MQVVKYAEYNDGRGPSAGLWGDLPPDHDDMNVGYGEEDDFLHYTTTATTVLNASGMPTFEGDCTLTGSAVAGGALVLFGTTDNEEAALERGGGAAAPYVISDTAAAARKLWFEARVKKSTIADAVGGFFVGLTSEGAGVADFMADSGADFADVDLIGFWNDPTDDSVSSHVHFVYQITGQAFATPIDTAATLVADTYIKLGFKYDPSAPTAKRIKIYVDGVEQATYVTGTNIATATFPDGEELTKLIAIKQQSNTDMTVSMDWWKAYQLSA